MTLLDHFRPPLSERRHWHAFHSAWATFIADDLNQRLPERYFAEPNVQYRVEIDVATLDTGEGDEPACWTPPAPAHTLTVAAPADVAQVRVFESSEGPELVAAIELVSPSNKDRPEARAAFASKLETYLQARVGVVLVDLVTHLQTSLHGELLRRLGEPAAAGPALYGAAYRPRPSTDGLQIDIWLEALDLGGPLPTLPLWLRDAAAVPLDLDASYRRTCRGQRIALSPAS